MSHELVVCGGYHEGVIVVRCETCEPDLDIAPILWGRMSFADPASEYSIKLSELLALQQAHEAEVGSS